MHCKFLANAPLELPHEEAERLLAMLAGLEQQTAAAVAASISMSQPGIARGRQ